MVVRTYLCLAELLSQVGRVRSAGRGVDVGDLGGRQPGVRVLQLGVVAVQVGGLPLPVPEHGL